MSRFLVYVSPAVGHTLPLVPGLLELQRRGHDIHVKSLPGLVDTLRDAGLDASPVAASVTDIPVTDYLAAGDGDRLRSGQVDLMERGRHDGPDLGRSIDEHRPDALLVDVNAYGAKAHAEASGLPWAVLLPSVLPMKGAGIPPYGPGFAPMRGPVGWLRDRLMWKVMEGVFGKAMLPGLNDLRAGVGLPPYTSPLEQFDPPTTVIALTAEPLEYRRRDLPDHVHLVGTEPWDPPSARPDYLDEPGDPWVLVTCSTEYQGDEELARVAVEALRHEPVRVLLTLADAYQEADLPPADNVRVERFVPHGHVLSAATAVVCHGGMGIVTKAASAGVPTVVVPFGRDQHEIARRVVESGAGVTVKPKALTPERLRSAVHEARSMAASAQEVAARLDPAGSAARFADAALGLVDGRVSPGGDSSARTA
jgi:UDP:flavonoid glycosyltransferase YjiC (YdhE family)